MSPIAVDIPQLARAESMFKEHYKTNSSFCRHIIDKGKPVKQFLFPVENCHVGYLQADNGAMQKAVGAINVPEDSAVTLYLQCVCTPYPEIIDKFSDGDLTGLEIVTFKPDIILPKLMQWKSLKHLSLFNTIERVEGIDCSKISRQDLLLVDKFTGLTTLGLCGQLKTLDLR
ncbi:MAG: hypothetical protein IPP57_14150 [Candidatus Obscuribacter sp.]|nr:hypothetical protein [Candidatus Obscuribacter sp.]